METANVPKEISAEYKKTAAEKAAEKGFSTRENTGEREQKSYLRLPEGTVSQVLYADGSYQEGMEEFIPYSGCEEFALKTGKIPEGSEEYVYYFDDTVIKHENWKVDGSVEYADLGVDGSSYSAFMEAFGEDGWIVIGRPVGPREGHLGYYFDGSSANGFVVTDYMVEEVLYGEELPKMIRIREDYLFADFRNEGNALLRYQKGWFALQNGFSILLFLKKSEGLPHYEIFGKKGGLPLTDDYKNYDQEYLDHLARYLNRDPEEFDKFHRELYQVSEREQSVYFNEHLENQTGRSLKEALAANSDDLLVALAETYKIRIWPGNSRVYEELQLPFSVLACEACEPDNKSSVPGAE